MARSCKTSLKLASASLLFLALYEVLHLKLSKTNISTVYSWPRKQQNYQISIGSVGATTESFLDVDSVMRKRRQHLTLACSILGWRNRSATQPTKMFYAKNYNFAYCSIPKTGCSNFKKILWLLNGKVTNISEIENHANSSTFHAVTRELFQLYQHRGYPQFASNYTKFIIVRHPFERLLSAYNNKLVPLVNGRKAQFSELGEEIRRRYGITRERREATGDHPTFEEFVDYVTNETLSGTRIEDHFLSFNTLCQPCSITYDVIAHVETLARDVRYLLKRIGAPEHYFQLNQGYSEHGTPTMTSDRTLKEFSKLPLNKIYRLYKAYRSNFLLFGYEATAYFKRRIPA